MSIEQATPRSVLGSLRTFSEEDLRTFLQLLGQEMMAEDLAFLLGELPVVEQKRFSDKWFEMFARQLCPSLIRIARNVARAHPEGTDDELDRQINEEAKQFLEEHEKAHTELAKAQFKQARERKADPETIQRNCEMIRRHQIDPKLWTHGKLAKEYEIPRPYVSRVLKYPNDWFELERKQNPIEGN